MTTAASSSPLSPAHYSWLRDAVGLEPKDLAELLPYHPGTALVYILRAGRKLERGETAGQAACRDYRKAVAHLNFEIERLERDGIRADNGP